MKRHSLEQSRDIHTIEYRTKTLQALSMIATPLVTPEGLNDEVLNDFLSLDDHDREYSRLQLPVSLLNNGDLVKEIFKNVLIRTLNYASNPADHIYCKHAYEGHPKGSVDYVVYSLQRAIHEDTAKITYSDRVVYTGTEADLQFGGYNKVPRLIISAPSYENSRKQYLWEELGDMLKNQPNKIKERMILQYAKEFSIPFAVLIAITSLMSLSDILNLFGNKQRTTGVYGASKVTQNAGLVIDIYNNLVDLENNRLQFHRHKFKKAAEQMQFSGLAKGLSPSAEHLISNQCNLGRFLHTPQAVFPTLGEYILKYAPSDFKDPGKTEFALKYSDVIITEPVTIFNSYERLPLDPNMPLPDCKVESIKHFLQKHSTEN